jgi:hypothetical protein
LLLLGLDQDPFFVDGPPRETAIGHGWRCARSDYGCNVQASFYLQLPQRGCRVPDSLACDVAVPAPPTDESDSLYFTMLNGSKRSITIDDRAGLAGQGRGGVSDRG